MQWQLTRRKIILETVPPGTAVMGTTYGRLHPAQLAGEGPGKLLGIERKATKTLGCR